MSWGYLIMDSTVIPSNLQSMGSPATRIDWHFGNTCQFACSYCPEHLHSGTARLPDFQQLQDFIIAVEPRLTYETQEPRIYFSFAGGEPTLNRHFGPLVRWLAQRGHDITVTTNGGRSLRWWQEQGGSINTTVLSYHSEFTDAQHMAQVARLQIQQGSRVIIKLIAHPGYFSRVQQAWQEFCGIDGANIEVKRIISAWLAPGHGIAETTPEQLQWIQQHQWRPGRPPRNPDLRFCLQAQDQPRRPMVPMALINAGRTDFQGWLCEHGRKNLAIDEHGQVWGAHCRQWHMGDIREPQDLRWPEQATTCQQTHCWCVVDLMIKKWRPDAGSDHG